MANGTKASGKTVIVEQFRAACRRPEVQTQTLKGLGLNKVNRRRTLPDTPETRGMVHRIRHLVRIVEDNA